MLSDTSFRIHSFQPLIKPQDLFNSLPLSPRIIEQVRLGRRQTIEILEGRDHRLLVVVGPCSIHDVKAALEYAVQLKKMAYSLRDALHIVMRVYFEKPRTSLGWKGLISDPHLDGSFDINHGLKLARQLLLEINELGLPAATEFLDIMTPRYISDLVSWSVIGARTVTSQIHRELASGLGMPMGFKNNSDGNIKAAIDAMTVAQYSHPLITIRENGLPVIMVTPGNPHRHIILRGSDTGTNYSMEHVEQTLQLLKAHQCPPRVMIDCSHGNSSKQYKNQPSVLRYWIHHIEKKRPLICGVMLESHLVPGKQALGHKKNLTYGQSITDSCIGWEETQDLLIELAEAVRKTYP